MPSWTKHWSGSRRDAEPAMAGGIVWPVSLYLGDTEDNLVAAQELAEEAGGEVERVHLEELARQRAGYRNLGGHRQR